MTEDEKKAQDKAVKDEKKLQETAEKEAAEKAATAKAEEKERKKAEAETKLDEAKKVAEKELQAAQEKKTALFKKPLFKVMKVNVKHNGLFYAKGVVCPTAKLEEFDEKGFIEEV